MSKGRILLVEDEPLLVFVLETALVGEGYEVVVSSSSSGAILELQREASAFDCLITDIRLPGGVDGWSIAERAREVDPAMPVIYASGDSASDWSEKGVSGSVMLTKPFTLETALNTVARIIAE